MVHCVSVLFLRNNIGQNTLKIHNPHFLICVTVFMKMLSRINIIITWNSKKRAAAAVSPWSGFIPLEILSFIWNNVYRKIIPDIVHTQMVFEQTLFLWWSTTNITSIYSHAILKITLIPHWCGIKQFQSTRVWHTFQSPPVNNTFIPWESWYGQLLYFSSSTSHSGRTVLAL